MKIRTDCISFQLFWSLYAIPFDSASVVITLEADGRSRNASPFVVAVIYVYAELARSSRLYANMKTIRAICYFESSILQKVDPLGAL